jgi:tetratricopeptide (TPR) repeat protein
MGNTKFKLKKFEESELSYIKAISIKQNYIEAYINLSKAQKELGRLKEAEFNARKALNLTPNFPEANIQLSISLFDIARLDNDLKNKDLIKLNEAKKFALKAIELKPNYPLAHFNLGIILQEFGKLDQARECYEKSLDLDPYFQLARDSLNILLNQIYLINLIKIKHESNTLEVINFKNKSIKDIITSKRKVEKNAINCLYKVNSIELNKAKGGPLFGNGKTSDYQLFDKDYKILKTIKKDLIEIIKKEMKSDVYIMDSFFNILGSGGGSVPHHHLNSFDKTFGLIDRKFSLTYYLSIGDQNNKEPGIFKLYEPNEEILPTEGMIMIIPSNRKHSAVYSGKSDRVMIGANFYLLN